MPPRRLTARGVPPRAAERQPAFGARAPHGPAQGGGHLTNTGKSRAQRASEIIASVEQAYSDSSIPLSTLEKLIKRLSNLSDEAVPQLIAKLRSADPVVRRSASSLLINLRASDAVEPLRELLDDPSLDEERKADILPLLDLLGAPVDDATFRQAVPHPGRYLKASLESLLEQVERPAAAETLLQSMDVVPPEDRGDFVRDFLVSRADRRLLAVFAALLHNVRDDVVVAAIDGLERIKEPAVAPLLDERAEHDSSPRVRRAAESASLRLGVRAAGLTPRPWFEPSRLPVAHCFVSTIDGSGGQVLFISRSLPSGDFRSLDLLFNDQEGLKDCFGFRADEASMAHMMEGFAPIDFVAVSLEQARDAIESARVTALEAGRRLPPAFMLYQGWLEGEDLEPPHEYPVPTLDPSREPDLLDYCGELLDYDEFESWFFNPSEVEAFVDQYEDTLRKGPIERHIAELKLLVAEAITEIITDDYRQLLARRLRRQAWLLAQLHEDQDVPLWALAAAAELERGDPREHPLLLAMMEHSLFNALDAD